MVNYLDNTGIASLINKYKKPLGIIVAVAMVASFIFSGEKFIPPRYKSVLITYPVNLIPYGNESPTEQMVQLFKSADIRQGIIDKYSFAKKYDIDIHKPPGKSKLYDIYDDNVIIGKNEFEAVKIEVWDSNPDTAAAIAMDMAKLMNNKTKKILHETALEIYNANNKVLMFKQANMDSMEKRLKELREKYGILNYQAQSKYASKEYLDAVSKGNSAKMKEVNNLIHNLQLYGGEFTALNAMLKVERKDYLEVLTKRDLAYLDATKDLSYQNIVTKPEPADKKSYPVRWIIVVLSTLGAFVLALFILAIIENRKRRITLE